MPAQNLSSKSDGFEKKMPYFVVQDVYRTKDQTQLNSMCREGGLSSPPLTSSQSERSNVAPTLERTSAARQNFPPFVKGQNGCEIAIHS